MLEREDDGSIPIAEIRRRVGAAADALGIARPSYERVRCLVHEARRRRAEPKLRDVVVDVAFRVRPPDAVVEHLSGVKAGAREDAGL